MNRPRNKAIALALVALFLAAPPAQAQFGAMLKKKLEEKAREQLGKNDSKRDTVTQAPAPMRGGAAAPSAPSAPPAASAPAAQPQGEAATDMRQRMLPVYPGAMLMVEGGPQSKCCRFATRDPLDRVVAFYSAQLGPGLDMAAFEARYPSTKQMIAAYRNANAKGYFFGQPEEMQGMANMAYVLSILDHSQLREFEIDARRMDSTGYVHLAKYMREALRIEPPRVAVGEAPQAAPAEDPVDADRDLQLTQAVLDRYLSARAAEAAEMKRQERYAPQQQQCADRVRQAMSDVDPQFVQGFCSGTANPTAAFPDPALVGAKAGSLKSYQYTRLHEHILAYYRIRLDKGARGIRQQDWKMWNAEAFAVLDRNWDRIVAAHRSEE